MHIVSGSQDNSVHLWDAVSGAHLNTLTGHSRPIHSTAFSPDGMCVVSASDAFTVHVQGTVSSGGTLQLWDAVSGAHLHMLTGHIGVLVLPHSPQMAHMLFPDLMTTLFTCGMQSAVRI